MTRPRSNMAHPLTTSLRHLTNYITPAPLIPRITQPCLWAGANDQGGFTLLEVLVTLVVVSIGLLGIVNLQLSGLKNNDSAYLRSQATLYSYEIMDRMRANRGAAAAGNYDQALSAFSDLPAPDATIAQIDRYDWYRKLDAVLPNAEGAIDCDANAICTITLQWDDTRAEGSTALKQIVVAGQL